MEEMHQSPQVGPNMMAGVGGVPNHSNNVNRRNRVRVTLHTMMLEKLPLHEAARLEMKSLPSKTPVSILQELLSRRGTIPKYELVQIKEAIHEPTFRYRVTVTDVVDPIVSVMGTGRSKKEAKHAAAKAVLDKLIGVNTEGVESPLLNSLPDSQNLQELQTYEEEKIVNNPIGALQEMCMSHHWPPPKYTMESEEGLPHERQFTIVCSILKYREVGQGKSKKVAKRHAAHKMWQALHDMNNQALKINYTTFLCRPSTSSLADYSVDLSAERQSQDTSSLPVQSFKETAEETGEFNEPSTSIIMGFDTNSTAECQNQESSELPVQSFEQTRKETSALDKSSTSSAADYSMAPTDAERQSGELSGLPVQSLKEMAEETGALDKPSTSSLADYSVDSSAERQSQDTSSSSVQSFKETAEETNAFNEPSTSITTGFDTNPTAVCRSQEKVDLDPQTCERSKKERARIGTVMTSRKKWSTLWNYFEELKPLLVKCTTCKKEIKVPHKTNRTTKMRVHLLKEHGIFFGDTRTLPDDLRKYYSELPGYKAKCKDCGNTLSFLTKIGNLQRHLRMRHSIKIQSRNKKVMTSRKKYSKLWNYFEELKPSLMKCTTCKKEIKVFHLTDRTTKMRAHLFNVHGISLDDDTLTLTDDLKQYYSELPGYKAKCKECCKTVSFLTHMPNLREHLRRRHSIRIQSRNKPSTSSLADNGMDRSAECQSEDTSGLSGQSFKEMTGKTGAHNESSISSLADNGMDPFAERQNQDTSDLLVQSFKKTTEKTGALKEPSTSSSMDYNTNPAAECQSQETIDLDPQMCKQSRKETRARDRSVIMAPKKKRSKLWNYFEKLKSLLVKCAICKIQIHMPHPSNSTSIMIGHLNRHGIFFNNDTFTLPDDLRQYYSELPGYKAKCNDCSKTMPFLTDIIRLRKHLRRHSPRILSR
ncbi:uncharacterized protein [Temnothorax longispinosus]|uniref:uncharacterized protein isoform X4 n=1 Tax=Temnothorax longispinosus TaxID=300112 RepID=UPI003A98E40D